MEQILQLSLYFIFKFADRMPLLIVLPMVLLPNTRLTNFLIRSKVVLTVLSLVYSVIFIAAIFVSYDSVTEFTNKAGG